MRDRFIELITTGSACPPNYDGEKRANNIYHCEGCKYVHSKDCTTERIADHLIANGVILPPCKLGGDIYMLVTRKTLSFETKNGRMQRVHNQHTFIKKTVLTKLNFFDVIDRFGKTVFLTKEEAEAKLKEKENGTVNSK